MIGNPILNLSIFFALVLFSVILFHPMIKLGKYVQSRAQRNKILKEDILKLLLHRKMDNKTSNVEEVKNALKKQTKEILQRLEDMEEDDLVISEGGMLQLTEEGQKYATKLIRSHRLVEKHLAMNTGYDKKEWHDIAEQKEHDFDDQSISQLSKELGHPLFDPHGDPIPTIGGIIINKSGNPLADFPINVPGKIVHIEDEPKYIYEKILREGIHLGSELIIKSKAQNTVEFFSEGLNISMPNLIANNITVVPMGETVGIDEDVFRLSRLNEGEEAVIVGISTECVGAKRRRLLDLGFVKGSSIKIKLRSPMGEPVAYEVRDAAIALREEQADLILVKLKSKTA